IQAAPALASGADTNTVSDAEGKVAEATIIGSQESLRSYLQIQEQLHNTLLAIEKNRQEAEAAAARNAEMLERRLGVMEKSLAERRLNDLKNIEHSDRMVLMAAGGFAAMGFVVLLLAAFMQWTAVNRLAAVAARLPASQPAPALGMGEADLMPSKMLEQSTARFMGVIEQLERRILAMEAGAKSAPQLTETSSADGDSQISLGLPGADDASVSTAGQDKAGAINLLLGKGQTLLKLDQPAAALDCFDEVLTLDPSHADALVKKGAALERLQRLDEAIECYDRAIARDNSMTMAYLYKGGVFNRLERYSEALECYEQALKSQQRGHAANVIID
ncbi:MAG: hypothetical protein JWQ04_1742, partial [Pedosphaera sp.]|nr:hypothetical protein [Pedosphaera sp.]